MPIAVITGGSRGFKQTLAEALTHEGWRLVINNRNPSALDRAAAALSSHTKVIAVAGNVADANHHQTLAASAASFKNLNLLVNNASDLNPAPLPTLDRYPLDELAHLYDINAIAPLRLVQLVLPLLITQRGMVVNVTSNTAIKNYEGWGGYESSKAALEQLNQILTTERPELAVYWFDPSDMRTDIHQAAFPGEDISNQTEPQTIIPALLRLITDRPANGRYRAAELLPVSG